MSDTSQPVDNNQPVIVNSNAFPKDIPATTETPGGLEGTTRHGPRSIEEIDADTAMLSILAELRDAEAKADGKVLTAPHDGRWAGPTARFQSLIASGAIENMRYEPVPSGGLEAQYDTGDWGGWARTVWEKIKHLNPHKIVRPATATADPLPDQATIAIMGDWGTGMYGATVIKDTLVRNNATFDLLMHLGDIYYSGTPEEVRTNFFAHWPKQLGKINRAINSNHEMYSGGFAYFDEILPAFGQNSSYFAFQNKHWTLIGLDVAYLDHAIDDQQVAWLMKILQNAGNRKVVLFSHHQLYSQFESQGTSLLAQGGFKSILESGRIFAWYWGHEHRCVLFDQPDPQFKLWGRCIGHGGMPQSRSKTKGLPKATEPIYQAADWRRAQAKSSGGLSIPSATVLEGRNPYIKNEEEKFLPHGYAILTLDGPALKEQVLDPTGAVIYEKKLSG